MTEAEARRFIGLLRRSAKFGSFTHTETFLDLEAQIGKGFVYVNVYDEDINANLIEGRKGVILLSNSYLSSSAYNILLAWLYEYKQGRIAEKSVNPLIKYNVKKFFGEQLIHFNNNVFSRSIFLETLLYEQHQMIPIIEAAESIEEWKHAASFITSMMGNLVMFHEVGHYYRNYLPEHYQELMNQYVAITKPFFETVTTNYPPLFVEEIRCDVFSLLIRLLSDKENAASSTLLLRATVMGFSIFALLWSLRKSAEATGNEQRKSPDQVQLHSYEKSTQEYTFLIGPFQDMIVRAQLMISFCERLALAQGITLYGQIGQLPLPTGMLEYFLYYLDEVMEIENNNQRGIARLMAEALHNHPDGLDYLYLHSKIFKAERPLSL